MPPRPRWQGRLSRSGTDRGPVKRPRAGQSLNPLSTIREKPQICAISWRALRPCSAGTAVAILWSKQKTPPPKTWH